MITFGNVKFESRESVKKYLARLLQKTRIGQSLQLKDKLMLKRVLETKNSEWSKRKIGCGVKDIIVANNDGFKSYCIVRIDNTKETFSYSKLIGKTGNISIRIVFRNEVFQQISTIRKKYNFTENFELHHITPFKTLVQEFIEINNIDIDSLKYNEQVNSLNCKLLDRDIAEKWLEYHRLHAEYLVLEKDDHRFLHDHCY